MLWPSLGDVRRVAGRRLAADDRPDADQTPDGQPQERLTLREPGGGGVFLFKNRSANPDGQPQEHLTLRHLGPPR